MKNVLITVTLALMLALAPNVFANGGEHDNTNCQGQGNENSPCEGDDNGGGGNPGGGGGTITNTNTVDLLNQQQQGFEVGDIGGDQTNRVTTGAVDASSETYTRVTTGDVSTRVSNDSSSDSSVDHSGNSTVRIGGDTTRLVGGDQITSNTNGDVNGSNTLIIGGEEEGGSTLSPVATSNQSLAGGDQTLTGGDNTLTGGDTTVIVNIDGMTDEAARALGQPDIVEIDNRDLSNESLEIDASVEIIDNSVYEAPVMSANSAATTFAGICSSGMSGQSRAYGISLSVTSDACANLMMADAYMAVGDTKTALEYIERAGRHVKVKGFLAHIRHVLTIGML